MKFYIKLTEPPYYKESKGKKIEYNGYPFYTPFKNQNESFDFYYKGLGINGEPIGNKTFEALKARIKKIGEKKFKEIAENNNQSIEDYIKEMKKQEKQNEKNKELIDILSYKLGIQLKIDGFMFWCGKIKINIFDFENKLRSKYGYNENEHGSLSDFIKSQFNEETEEQIRQVI